MDHDKRVQLERNAEDWWFRVGYGTTERGGTTVQFPVSGGTINVIQLLADFAAQLPFQQEAATLTPPNLKRLEQIANALLEHDPWRKAFEDHMAICNRPVIIQVDREVH